MTRRSVQIGGRDRRSGRILDPLPGEEHLDQMPILQRAMLPRSKRVAPLGPVCGCPPPMPHHLGGCRPGLIRVEGGLAAICQTCRKPLVRGVHRRRDQVHVLGLVELGPDQLDLEDLVDAGLLERMDPDQTGTEPDWRLEALEESMRLERPGGLP